MTLLARIPVLETDRLIMRSPTLSDVDAEAEFFSSDRSTYVGGPLPREQVWRAVAAMIGHWVLRGFGLWALEDKANGAYCGRAGLWAPEGWPEKEIAWTLMGPAEGRGLAYEAALKAREHAYHALGWTTAISMIAVNNHRSRNLAERLGATQESEFIHERSGPALIYRHPGPDALT